MQMIDRQPLTLRRNPDDRRLPGRPPQGLRRDDLREARDGRRAGGFEDAGRGNDRLEGGDLRLAREGAAKKPERGARRAAFAWVRDDEHLERSLSDLSGLFWHLRGRNTAGAPTRLLGVWIGNRPESPDPAIHEAFREGAVRIQDSAGVGGVWTLCWLEDPSVSAEELRCALHDAYGPDSPARFVPVLASDKSQESETRFGAERLPIVQDPSTGQLTRPVA